MHEIRLKMIQFFVMNDHPLAYEDDDFMESTEARQIRILDEYLDPLRRLSARAQPHLGPAQSIAPPENDHPRQGGPQGCTEAKPQSARVVALLRGRTTTRQGLDQLEHVTGSPAASV